MLKENPVRENPIKEVGKEVAHIFTQYLLGHQSTMDYLKDRGIDLALLDEEMIGYCPPFLNYWFLLMKGRITVPIHDVHGEIVAFAGRQYAPAADAAKESIRSYFGKELVLAEDKVVKWERGKWLNEPYPKVKHLYNLHRAKNAIRKMGYVILVEGYFDALVMASNGFPNTVAICSTSLSDRQAVLIKRYCSNVVLLLDGDDAGVKGLDKLIPCLEKYELSHYAIFLPQGYDPDDFVIKIGEKKMRKVIDTMMSENKLQVKLNLK